MWRKMTRKGVSLREVFDARALRVVVDDQNGAKLQQVLNPEILSSKTLIQKHPNMHHGALPPFHVRGLCVQCNLLLWVHSLERWPGSSRGLI